MYRFIQSELINAAEQHDKEAKVVDEVCQKAQTECISCGDQFRDEATTLFDQCAHEREFCPECLERWTQIQLDSTMIEEGVRCPSTCTQILKCKDLRGSISTILYERLKRAVRRAALRKIPGYRECMLDNCDSGQFHDDATDGHVFKCRRCGFLACTIHNMPFHEGETCSDYDERMELYSSIIRTVEEASEKEVQRISKPCPNCTVNIQKISGCDHMTCKKCRHEFCYPCGASYMDMGSTDRAPHTVTCPHYIRPSQASLGNVHLMGSQPTPLISLEMRQRWLERQDEIRHRWPHEDERRQRNEHRRRLLDELRPRADVEKSKAPGPTFAGE